MTDPDAYLAAALASITPQTSMIQPEGRTLTWDFRIKADPLKAMQDLVDQLASTTPVGRRVVAHRRRLTGIAADGHGSYLLEGRSCCFSLCTRVFGALDRWDVPSDHTCPECDRTFELSYGVGRRTR
jgi:hypothetical protein